MSAAPKPRILVVDDDPLLRGLVGEALGKAGFRVVEAEDAMQSVIQAEGMRLDLVVCDIMMPHFGSGVDAYHQMRRSPYLPPDLAILFITGMPLKEALTLIPKGDERVRLVQKPVDLEKLIALVHEMLDRART